MEKGGGDRKKQERERETEKERERERERRIVALRRHFESIATTCLEEEKRRRGDERTRGREDEEATRAFCSGTAVNAPNGRTEHSLFVENQVL